MCVLLYTNVKVRTFPDTVWSIHSLVVESYEDYGQELTDTLFASYSIDLLLHGGEIDAPRILTSRDFVGPGEVVHLMTGCCRIK